MMHSNNNKNNNNNENNNNNKKKNIVLDNPGIHNTLAELTYLVVKT